MDSVKGHVRTITYRKWSAACSLACSQAVGRSTDTLMPSIVTLGWAVDGSPVGLLAGWSPPNSLAGGSLGAGASAAESVASVALTVLD